MTRSAWLVPLLVACVSGPEPVEVEGFEVRIVTPTAASTFGWSDPIPLDVEVTRGGAALTPDTVTWNIGAWTGTGDGIVAEGVPAGDHIVTAAVLVDGVAGTATAPIRVEPPPDVAYAGPLHSTIELSNGWLSGSATCSGTVDFTLREGSVIDGTGQADCAWSGGDFSVAYVLDGTVVQGNAAGTMTTDYEGQALSMPWVGTGSYGTTIGGAFDLQQSQDGGSMHLYGDFQADPL